MSELIKELVKIVQDGDIAIDNLIDIDSESESIFKKFPFMSITEKKEAIKRYQYLRGVKPEWMEQIALVKEFLLNTVSDLSSLEDGWFEKRVESRKLKKLHKMLETEFETEKEKEVAKQAKISVPNEEVVKVVTAEAKEALKKDIQEIQAQKKEANKNIK